MQVDIEVCLVVLVLRYCLKLLKNLFILEHLWHVPMTCLAKWKEEFRLRYVTSLSFATHTETKFTLYKNWFFRWLSTCTKRGLWKRQTGKLSVFLTVLGGKLKTPFWRRRMNHEWYQVYKDANIIKRVKYGRLQWAGRLVRVLEKRIVKIIFSREPVGMSNWHWRRLQMVSKYACVSKWPIRSELNSTRYFNLLLCFSIEILLRKFEHIKKSSKYVSKYLPSKSNLLTFEWALESSYWTFNHKVMYIILLYVWEGDPKLLNGSVSQHLSHLDRIQYQWAKMILLVFVMKKLM